MDKVAERPQELYEIPRRLSAPANWFTTLLYSRSSEEETHWTQELEGGHVKNSIIVQPHFLQLDRSGSESQLHREEVLGPLMDMMTLLWLSVNVGIKMRWCTQSAAQDLIKIVLLLSVSLPFLFCPLANKPFNKCTNYWEFFFPPCLVGFISNLFSPFLMKSNYVWIHWSINLESK